MALTSWRPDRTTRLPPWPVPTLGVAMARGLMGRCPACGKGKLFKGFLTVVPSCENCAAPLGSARADDAPPYFVILITGHIVIPLMLLTQKMWDPSNLTLTAIFVPMTLVLAVGLLRPTKGAVLGVMVTMRMLTEDPAPG